MEIFFSSGISRSLIRMPDRTTQASVNSQSSVTIIQLRTTDIMNSIEYRELEKTNKELKIKVADLSAALKRVSKEKKRLKEAYMCK